MEFKGFWVRILAVPCFRHFMKWLPSPKVLWHFLKKTGFRFTILIKIFSLYIIKFSNGSIDTLNLYGNRILLYVIISQDIDITWHLCIKCLTEVVWCQSVCSDNFILFKIADWCLIDLVFYTLFLYREFMVLFLRVYWNVRCVIH